MREISVYYDAGNREQLLSIDGGKIISRSAQIFKSSPIRHASNGKADFVTVADATYVIGDTSVPYARSVHGLDLGNDEGKVDNALPFILAMTAGLSRDSVDAAKITRLLMMHPNPTPEIVAAVNKKLVGEHRAIVNSRKVVRIVEEGAIEVYAEPVPSAAYLASQGLLFPSDRTVIVDIGGKTLCIQGFDENGPNFWARGYMGDSGVKALADRIAKEMQVAIDSPLKGQMAKLDIIMDALKEAYTSNTQTRSYWYGTGSNRFEFTKFVPNATLLWATDVMKACQSTMADQNFSWNQIWFVGGGAHYIPAKFFETNGLARADQPELTNVLGLIELGRPEHLEKIGFALPNAA